MCLVVILTLVLCWSPLLVSHFLELATGPSIILLQVKLCGIALVFLNSALDPYTYAQNHGTSCQPQASGSSSRRRRGLYARFVALFWELLHCQCADPRRSRHSGAKFRALRSTRPTGQHRSSLLEAEAPSLPLPPPRGGTVGGGRGFRGLGELTPGAGGEPLHFCTRLAGDDLERCEGGDFHARCEVCCCCCCGGGGRGRGDVALENGGGKGSLVATAVKRCCSSPGNQHAASPSNERLLVPGNNDRLLLLSSSSSSSSSSSASSSYSSPLHVNEKLLTRTAATTVTPLAVATPACHKSGHGAVQCRGKGISKEHRAREDGPSRSVHQDRVYGKKPSTENKQTSTSASATVSKSGNLHKPNSSSGGSKRRRHHQHPHHHHLHQHTQVTRTKDVRRDVRTLVHKSSCQAHATSEQSLVDS